MEDEIALLSTRSSGSESLIEETIDGMPTRFVSGILSVIGLCCRMRVMDGWCVLSPLHIVVMNPMTRVQHELPPLQYGLWTLNSPTMVQITVDYEAKRYKVIVAGKRKGHFTAEIYDSRSRQWTSAAQSFGSAFGRAYKWISSDLGASNFDKCTPCTYDFADGDLELHSENNLIGMCPFHVKDYTLLKDSIFVLHEETQKYRYDRAMLSQVYCITEYQNEHNAKNWMQVRVLCRYQHAFGWSMDLVNSVGFWT